MNDSPKQKGRPRLSGKSPLTSCAMKTIGSVDRPLGDRRVWLDGYVQPLTYQEDGYDWNDVEAFLQKLKAFCAAHV